MPEKQKLIFAFALDGDGRIQRKHFGDAVKFSLYKFSENSLIFQNDVINSVKEENEKVSHGSKTKGEAIVKLLKTWGVQVILSGQFGKNIEIVRKHFQPVLLSDTEFEKAHREVEKNLKTITNTLHANQEQYKAIRI